MKNLKKILALLLVLALAVGMVACAKSEAPVEESKPAEESKTEEVKEEEPEAEPYTITISVQESPASKAGWEAVAAGYEALNPNADVVVDLKPDEGYSDWVKTIGADYMNNTVDIVSINLVSDRKEGQTINWNEYMEDVNPYDADGKIWKETFSYNSQSKSSIDGSFDALSAFSVQVKWFYNADIFEEVGVTAPKTWDEFVDICAKIYDAGYQPLAIEGDYNSFYAMRMGWLSQMYADQTTRTQLEITRAQPGDYCYDPDVDGKFVLDLTDPWNDDSANVNINNVRFWAAVADGTLSANTPGTVAVWENFKKLWPKYAGGDAFFGTTDAMPLFYQGKAAITVHVGGFGLTLANNFKKIEAGESLTTGSGEDAEVIEGAKVFKVGSFNMPSMTNPSGKFGPDEIFQAPARTIEVATGFLGAFSRSAEQDAHCVDFMMYYFSAQGMSKYIDAFLANGGSVDGPNLVYGVEYPAEVAASFEGSEFIGNCQKQKCQAFARGLADNQESTRRFYELAQQCLTDQITCEDYARLMAEQHLQYMDEAMGTSISRSDLENPANEPTGNEG